MVTSALLAFYISLYFHFCLLDPPGSHARQRKLPPLPLPLLPIKLSQPKDTAIPATVYIIIGGKEAIESKTRTVDSQELAYIQTEADSNSDC